MASNLDQPEVLIAPFAYNGDRNTIPALSTGTQEASLEDGFPRVTELPISEGGIPPQRIDFNGLGYLLSSQFFYLQNGGKFTFNQQVSDAIGGYPKDCILQYTSGEVTYQVVSLINEPYQSLAQSEVVSEYNLSNLVLIPSIYPFLWLIFPEEDLRVY